MKKYMKIGASSCVDMINAFNTKIMELDPSQIEGSSQITAAEDQEYITGSGVNDQYVDDMMQYVADETVVDPENPCVCTWTVENGNIIFVLTGLEGEYVEEYTCPIEDLTGDIDQDMNYILDSIAQ